jgi:methionyl aminopeptidase
MPIINCALTSFAWRDALDRAQRFARRPGTVRIPRRPRQTRSFVRAEAGEMVKMRAKPKAAGRRAAEGTRCARPLLHYIQGSKTEHTFFCLSMNNLDLSRSQLRESRIKLHGPEAFEGMRRAGQLAAQALDMLVPHVQPGVSTERLDDLVVEFALAHGAIPAPLHYRGFPKATCTSINHVVCHGIPNAKPLKEGDIVNIDVTLILDGWHGDTSRMYAVGHISRRAERLIDVTYEALMRGVAAVKPGHTTGHIGAAIQSYAERERCGVVRDFCGHGLGRVFHDRPNILHYGEPGDGVVLEPGMLFTIEPMINLGKPHVKILPDGWTAVTRDRELSAQFEHTVGVTETGCQVFTTSPMGLHRPPYRLA